MTPHFNLLCTCENLLNYLNCRYGNPFTKIVSQYRGYHLVNSVARVPAWEVEQGCWHIPAQEKFYDSASVK